MLPLNSMLRPSNQMSRTHHRVKDLRLLRSGRSIQRHEKAVCHEDSEHSCTVDKTLSSKKHPDLTQNSHLHTSIP